MITLFTFAYALLLLLGLASISYIVYKIAQEVTRNNAQPVLTLDAQVIDKEADTSGDFNSYYGIFEIEGRECRRFLVPWKEYRQLSEGSRGALTFQGTRYKGFTQSEGGRDPNG